MTFVTRMLALSGLFASLLHAAPPPASAYSIPLRFEPNAGQAPPSVKYVSRSREYSLELENRLMRLRPRNGSAPMEWAFERADGERIRPEKPWGAAVNYYASAATARRVQAWGAVRYDGLYPGIDLIVYENHESWEFDYIAAPNSDPSRIGFNVTGARRVEVDSSGDLVATTLDGENLRWRKPRAYQGEHAVQAGFEVKNRHVRLRLGNWDHSKELVIDPSFVFSTYVGGRGDELARGIAVDSSGNIYMCGGTNSQDLPTTASSFQPNYRGTAADGIGDGFLAKFTPAGVMTYITYVGGSGDDTCTALTVDSGGNVVIVGSTNSTDFPATANAAQKTFGGSGGNNGYSSGDAYVAKFNSTGGLTWATYLGGSADDAASAVALDTVGNIYVTGLTLSPNFPGASGGYQSQFHGSANTFINQNGYVVWWNSGDAFVAKLDPAGHTITNSTYLGGSADDGATSIALDASGNVWIGGVTQSFDFPVASPFQSSYHGSSTQLQPIVTFGDGFISKLNGGLSQLLYSTYLGGSGDDGVSSIAVDASGMVYAAGFTLSSDFPIVQGSYQTAFHGPTTAVGRFLSLGDAFVTKLNPATNKLVYSTFLGGSDDDAAGALAVDKNGDVFVGGLTKSSDFPVSANAMQGALAGRSKFFDAIGDGFLAELDPAGAHLLYSSYLGGNAGDAVVGLTLDAAGTLYVTGATNSTNFPTTPGLQTKPFSNDGRIDTFVAAISMSGSASVTSTLPHVADGNGFGTLALLINTGTTDAAYSLQFFNQSGAQVTYPLDPAQSGMTGVIHAGSQAMVRTTGSGTSTSAGWGQLTAPAAVKGMLIYQQKASATSLQEGSAPIAAPSQHFFVPFDNTNGDVTSIGFANPSPTQIANVNFTVRYESGGTDTVPVFAVNPLQQLAQPVTFFWGGTAGKRGMIEVNANTPIGLVAFRFQGSAFTLVDTIAPTAGSSTAITSTIAHSADGNNFRSTFLLTNSGTVDANYTLSILNATGQPQTFNFDVPNPLAGTVPAGSTRTIDTTGLGTVTNLGWAQLSAAPAVSGIEVFRQTNPGQSEQQATVPITQTNLAHFFLPFDNAANTTSIALANPDPAVAATINVTFRYVDGSSNAGQLMLSPRNYNANLLSSLFSATTGKAGVAEFSSNAPVAVVEVRFNPTQAFTSLRALGP